MGSPYKTLWDAICLAEFPKFSSPPTHWQAVQLSKHMNAKPSTTTGQSSNATHTVYFGGSKKKWSMFPVRNIAILINHLQYSSFVYTQPFTCTRHKLPVRYGISLALWKLSACIQNNMLLDYVPDNYYSTRNIIWNLLSHGNMSLCWREIMTVIKIWYFTISIYTVQRTTIHLNTAFMKSSDKWQLTAFMVRCFIKFGNCIKQWLLLALQW